MAETSGEVVGAEVNDWAEQFHVTFNVATEVAIVFRGACGWYYEEESATLADIISTARDHHDNPAMWACLGVPK